MPPKKRPKPSSGRSRYRHPLLETEAGCSGQEEEEGPSEEEESGEESQELRPFIDDSSLAGDSPLLHLALDNRQREMEDEALAAEFGPVQPYFPAGLARTPEEPLEFNFQLFLYDSMTLARGLFPDDQEGEVRFENLDQCREYCQRYVEARQRWCARQQPSADRTEERRRQLDKEAMFQQAGRPLAPQLLAGNELLDGHLEDLRLDGFGNVMFLRAPFWSDIAPQFMHGFPRRLVPDSHGGILPGNMTVAARISNQAVRSLATGDVAAFVSHSMVQGLGLTTAELMLARLSAIKYAGKRDKPARLIDLMLRFGLDFLTITPLAGEQLEALRATSNRHWSSVLLSLLQPGDPESGSSSSSESELSVSWNTADEVATAPGEGAADQATAVRRQVETLLHCFVSTVTTTERVAVEGETAGQPRPIPGSSGYHERRRKQPTPRRAVRSASRDTSGPSTSTSQQQGPMAGAAADMPRPAPANAREALLALPEIAASRIPNDSSLAKLAQFLEANQPCDPEPISRQTGEPARQEAAVENYQQTRDRTVDRGVNEVWRLSKADCVCLPERLVVASQDSDEDQACPYCQCDAEGRTLDRATEMCRNDNCNVCLLINRLDGRTLAALGLKRNQRLTAMLNLAPSIARYLNSGELPEERRRNLIKPLCLLLGCKQTKLRYVGNVGFLCMLCPRLKHLQLNSGWGEVWCNLSKIASAVGYHGNHRTQLAALVFILQRCVSGSSNKWRWYLQRDDRTEEESILSEIFAGCFEQTPEASTSQAEGRGR